MNATTSGCAELPGAGDDDTVWLVRYGEISLKSVPVRTSWEKQLIGSILGVLPACRASREWGRIWLTGPVDPVALGRVFGIVSFSPCRACSLDELEETLLQYIADSWVAEKGTFALRVRRIGEHSFSSQECASRLGSRVREWYPGLGVDLKHADITIHIEIRGERCYLYHKVFPGAGGIPLGVEGSLVLLLSGGIDSAVAAWMMMKRGCRIIPVFIDMPPFLGESALERTEAVIRILRGYQPDIQLRVVEDTYVARIREELRSSGDEKFICLLCKRRMYRLAEEVAHETGAKGIVTGESMGQVASQTLENLAVLHAATTMPVYRPLIGLDKREIVDIARKIGTYEPSIMPVSSCCCAVPKKPATRADPEKILNLEGRLNESTLDLIEGT